MRQIGRPESFSAVKYPRLLLTRISLCGHIYYHQSTAIMTAAEASVVVQEQEGDRKTAQNTDASEVKKPVTE